MTKEQVIATIKEAAERHGLTTCKYTMTRLIEIKEPGDTHYLNFLIQENLPEGIDWSKREVTMNLHFRASLASMGGEPTPEDLLKAAEIIKAGALLVQELDAMNLSYTERH